MVLMLLTMCMSVVDSWSLSGLVCSRVSKRINLEVISHTCIKNDPKRDIVTWRRRTRVKNISLVFGRLGYVLLRLSYYLTKALRKGLEAFILVSS